MPFLYCLRVSYSLESIAEKIVFLRFGKILLHPREYYKNGFFLLATELLDTHYTFHSLNI